MKRFFLFVAILVFVGAGALYIASLLVDKEAYRNELVGYIERLTGVTPVIKGEVDVSVFPYPTLTVKEVVLPPPSDRFDEKLFVAPSVFIELSYWSLFFSGVDIEAIHLRNPVINVEVLSDGSWNWDLSRSGVPEDLGGNVFVHFGIVTYYDHYSGVYRRYEQVNSDVQMDGSEGPFNLQGDYYVKVGDHGKTYRFDAKVAAFSASGADAHVHLQTNTYDLVFAGQVNGVGVHSTVSGDISVTGPSFAYFFWELFSDSLVVEDVYDVVDDSFELSAALHYDNHQVALRDVAVSSSESIAGRGDITMYMGHRPVTEVRFDLEYITLDYLIEKSGEQEVSFEGIRLPLSTVLVRVESEEAHYNGGIMRDVSMDAQVVGGVMEIHPLKATLPGDTVYEFRGSLDKLAWMPDNDVVYSESATHSGPVSPLYVQYSVPELTGSFSASGASLGELLRWLDFRVEGFQADQLDDFVVRGDVRGAPYVFEVPQFKAVVGDMFLKGGVKTTYGVGRPRVFGQVYANNLDFDAWFMGGLISDAFDVKDYLAGLRLLDFDLYLETGFESSVVGGQKVDDLLMVVSVSPSQVALEKISIRSDLAEFDASVALDITELDPTVRVEVSAEKFDTALLRSVVRDTSADNHTASQGVWSRQAVDLSWITQFDGAVDVRVGRLLHQGTLVDNIVLLGKISDKALSIDTFTAVFADGNLDMKGRFSSVPVPRLSGSFRLDSADAGGVLQYLFGFKNFSGKTSLIGSFVTSGTSPYAWVSQLNGVFQFAARGLEVKGLDIHHFMDYIFTVPEDQILALAAQDLSAGTMQLYSADGNVRVENGILQLEQSVIKTTRSTAAFNGYMNLTDWVMAMTGKFAFIVFDPKTEQNANLSVGVKYEGSVDSPSQRNNYRAIRAYLKKR